jgi:hypothetical protein
MRILVVAPVTGGSGETVTARYLAQSAARQGHDVFFLASAFAARFLADEFAGRLTEFTAHGPTNVAIWDDTLQSVRPHVVVFADYPLMFWASGVVPLAREDGWARRLEDTKACLVTLDHFGFAQAEMEFFFGPPHLVNTRHQFGPIPSGMKIMLPCPMHEPLQVAGRKGRPFRYLDAPTPLPAAVRAQTRARYGIGDRGLLVFHIVSNWAWQSAAVLGLKLYERFNDLLDHYLGTIGRPLTVVSLNNGTLLRQSEGSNLRIINVGAMSPPEFDKLLFSSDLLLTENKISISIGKAICGLHPAGAFVNSFGIMDLLDRATGRLRELVLAIENDRPGSIYPFDVFPTGMQDVLQRIILYRDNSLTSAFTEIELFGGDRTQQALRAMLTDDAVRSDMSSRQRSYVQRLNGLPDAATTLAALVDEGGS